MVYSKFLLIYIFCIVISVNAYERSRGLSGPVSLTANGLSESSDGSEETNHSPRVRNKRMKTVPK